MLLDCFCTCFLLLQVEAIRRAKPIVGDELVDIEYRIFDGPNMLSAETVVETMNRLTEGEMVSTLKYAVRRRSFITSELKVLYYYVGNYYYYFFSSFNMDKGNYVENKNGLPRNR